MGPARDGFQGGVHCGAAARVEGITGARGRGRMEVFRMQGFRKFLLRGNVVDLAVAVVIGAAFGAVVQALVKDLLTPLIGAFGGVPDFSALYFTINGSRFLIGDFINALLSFVLLAAVIYYLVV